MAATPPHSGHVFISYRQVEPDKSFAHRLAYDLQAAGHPVWIDVQAIEAGQTWNTEIQKALDGCYAYVVVLTPEAMASQWVRNELLYALSLKAGAIYPVLLIDVRLPPELISIQYVDFRDNYGKALADLIAHLPVPPASGIAPMAKPAISLVEPPARRWPPIWTWATGVAGLAVLALLIFLGMLIGSGGKIGAQPTPTLTQLADVIQTEPPTAAPTATAQPTGTPAPTPTATSTPLGAGAGHIAFSTSRDDPKVSKCGAYCNDEIYVMNADGSAQTRLTTNPADDGYPSWSPDGKYIAFDSTRNGDGEVFVMNADGSGLRNATRNLGNDYNPAWSPDGTRIAFDSTRSGNDEIYVMNANGSAQTRLTNNSANDNAPAWSPDGEYIAFVSNRDGHFQIYAMGVDGSDPLNLSNDSSNDVAPAWSPDGTRIAFQSDSDGRPEIFAMNADGSGVTNLTNNPAGNYSPAWGP